MNGNRGADGSLFRGDMEQNRFESPEMHQSLLEDAYDRQHIVQLPTALALLPPRHDSLRLSCCPPSEFFE